MRVAERRLLTTTVFDDLIPLPPLSPSVGRSYDDSALMAEVVITIHQQPVVEMRRLVPQDTHRIKELCSQWFPIQYPEHWFDDITSNPRFFSLGAVIDGQLEGLIVSELKPQSRCNREDRGIVAQGLGPDPVVAYILSLGVVVGKRRNGIGSMLLQQLIHFLQSHDSGCQCKAVFLHVLSSNSDAIRFYESQHFSRHQFLPLYYFIDGKCLDGLSYVRYMNGGRAPVTLSLIGKFALDISSSLFTSCSSRLFHAFKCMGQFLNWKVARIAKLPARIMHRLPHTVSQHSSAVKYHQVASA